MKIAKRDLKLLLILAGLLVFLLLYMLQKPLPLHQPHL